MIRSNLFMYATKLFKGKTTTIFSIMMMIVLVTFLLMCHVTPVTSLCNMTADTCIFHLNISRELTMVHKGSVVKVHAGKAYSSDTTVYNNNTAIPPDEVFVKRDYIQI